ncbi:MAG TPA: TlpA disulfide reductase family protein [Ktedonobacteraceae bacterium]|jgi:cytochrome c biogenesis protein CcmG/thiol:disulfide interchange protein DsbE|nr:TlpA disulfide reductase family protein [Ktedonobacteraceae bacterium]
MAQRKLQEKDSAKAEQSLARKQRQELKDELTENFANRPRMPKDRRRLIIFCTLGAIALLAGIFTILVLLPAPAEEPHGGIAVGTAAPEFNLPIQGGPGAGGTLDLRSLRGHPVVINFWSESCQPCLSEVPYLRDIYAHYHAEGAFILLGIDQADPRGDIGTFGQTFKVNYPLLFDPGSATNIKYGVTSLPMTYFIDSKGIVRYVVPQQLTPQAMEQGLEAIGVTIS